MDVARLRQETPGTDHVFHFNNAGASLMPKVVSDSLQSYLEEESLYGGYETAEAHKADLEAFYDVTAQLINAKPSEIAFAENATLAWTRIFYSIPFQKGDVILTSRVEYASNYIAYLQLEKRIGLQIRVVPSNEHGEIDIQALEAAIDDKVKLISITHMPTNSGLVNPAEEVGRIAAKYNIPFLLDACQSIGQYPVDVQALKCDFLSATGRKYLRGPRGTGFLYVSEKYLNQIEPYTLDLHSARWTTKESYEVRPDARKFEVWECYFAGKVALSSAISYAREIGMDNIWERIMKLSAALRNKLSSISGIQVKDIGRIKSGIITFTVAGKSPNDIKDLLKKERINVSVIKPDNTLIDSQGRDLTPMVRASIHYYNTEEEIDHFCQKLENIVVQIS
ncbi:MAG: aminotransferase class V-fold PLP-dependent enzyme [Bacteroidota bacterium]